MRVDVDICKSQPVAQRDQFLDEPIDHRPLVDALLRVSVADAERRRLAIRLEIDPGNEPGTAFFWRHCS